MITGPQLDLSKIKRVLVVRLRSIGDTVLITPSLIALRRALPNAKIDVLLEDWVAPVLDGFDQIDEVLSFEKSSKRSRFAVAREIRKREYDVAFNLHGGTTSTFFVRVSGAKHRVGYGHYRYSFLYNHLLTSSADFWGRAVTHSAEQHLALIGSVGIPVDDRPKTRLNVTESAAASLNSKFEIQDSRFKAQEGDPQTEIPHPTSRIALLHPVAAFETKELAVGKFAEIAEFLSTSGFEVVAVGAPNEREKVERLRSICKVPILAFCDLSLPEITALAARAGVFVGNDSGIAHIAAAVGCPSVVIFGSSNRDHWGPWTNAPHEIVFEPFDCQPCAGYRCGKFDSPRCIESVSVDSVVAPIGRVISSS